MAAIGALRDAAAGPALPRHASGAAFVAIATATPRCTPALHPHLSSDSRQSPEASSHGVIHRKVQDRLRALYMGMQAVGH